MTYLVLGIPDPVARRIAEDLLAQGATVFAVGPPEARGLLPAGVRLFLGDAASIDFGLGAADYRELLGRAEEVILADTSYVSSGDVERNRLVRQAAEVSEFVKAGGAPRGVRYLSSLLVFGDASGEISEDDFEVGQRFGDEYEESLAVAEKIVRTASFFRPLSIVRTAPISGDEESGELLANSPLSHLARQVKSGGYDGGYTFSDLPVYFETIRRAARALLRVTPTSVMSVVHLLDREPTTDRELVTWLAEAAGKSVHERSQGVRLLSAWSRPHYPGSRALCGWGLRISNKRADELLGDLLDRDPLLILRGLFVSPEGNNAR